jgi:periplasmic protein TonB
MRVGLKRMGRRGSAEKGIAACLPEGESPSGRASVASLAIHAALLIAAIAYFGSDQPRVKPPAATMLTESRIVSPSLKHIERNVGAGGGGGAHRPIVASRGQTPPFTRIRAFVAPTIVTNPAPKLPVSATLLDAQPPKIDAQEYGDPRSQSIALSAGMGFGGIGSGIGPGDGIRGENGYGGGSGDGSVYRWGDLTVAPVLILKVEPGYSEEARRARFQGAVLMRLIIDQSGTPRSVQVVRAAGLGLDELAVNAVKQWRFRPGMKDGRAVAVRANAEVSFRFL